MTRGDGSELSAYLALGRRLVDDALDRSLPPLGTPPPALHAAMRYTLLLPGKRLRGVLVLASCEMLKGDREDALPLAAAIEMVHAASLILDDLPSMDDATLRRGRPTLHKVAGEANAILAAVGLLNAAFGLVGGQVVDLESTGRRLELESLEYIHAHKTGALFIAATELGALAAGARERDVEALSRFAKNLGLAFQITDDLLDYSGNPETTGKDAGLDRDRTTFVNLCGIDGARRLAEELVAAAVAALEPFGKRASVLAGLAEMVRERDR